VFQSVSRYDQDSSSVPNNLINQFFMYCDALDGIMEDSFGADEDKDEPCSLSMSTVSWLSGQLFKCEIVQGRF